MRYIIISHMFNKNNIGSVVTADAAHAIEDLEAAGYAVPEGAIATAEVGNIRIRDTEGNLLLELC